MKPTSTTLQLLTLATAFFYFTAQAEIDFSKYSDKFKKNYGSVNIMNFSGYNIEITTSSNKLQMAPGTIQSIKTNPRFTFEKISYLSTRSSKKKAPDLSTCESVTGEITLSDFDLSRKSLAGLYIGTKRESINAEEKLHCFVINFADEETLETIQDTFDPE